MQIRIFRAASLAEAMAQVRDTLGLDALILATEGRAGLVEVTAALDPDAGAGSDFDDYQPLPPIQAAVPEAPPPAGRSPLDRHNLPEPLHAVMRKALAIGVPSALEAACSRTFRFGRLPLDAAGPPLMLVGSPGSGKTLTVAKLATRLVMEGHRPLVITADERRAGAVEQLAAFTRLLGLTLIAAGRPEMLKRALARREPLSPVLIDAPGLDLLDPAQDELLTELLAASASCTALVMPAGLDAAEAVEIAEAHARHATRLIVPTRLDRNGRLGAVLAAAEAGQLLLTEAGTGTDVADGLKQLTPAFIAGRLTASAPANHVVVPAGDSPIAQFAPPTPLQPPQPLPAVRTVPERDVLSLHMAAQAAQPRSLFGNNDP